MNYVDFAKLNIGSTLFAYELTNNGLVEIYRAYPLIYKGSLVALAMDSGDANYQISTSLASKINKSNMNKLCIIYDSNNVYSYNGDSIFLLASTSENIKSRASLNDISINSLNNNTILCDLSETINLNYISRNYAKAQTYWSCGVKYIPQGSGTKICWAATIACINNYVNGTSLTAVAVAKAKFGNSNYNNGVTTDVAISFMISEYGLYYTYTSGIPSNNAMLKSIKNGYPVYGCFSWASGKHAATIYGIDLISGYVSVMDPEFGATTSYTNGSTYTYISNYSGVKLTLQRGGYYI